MTQLSEALTAPEKKPAVVTDLAALIEGEIQGMGGLTGIAAKAAVKAAQARNPKIIERGSAAYVGTLADALDPFWTSFRASGGTDFGAYLKQNEKEANAAVLAAVDAEVPAGGKERGMYEKFKPQIGKVLVGALPKLGALVQKHAG